jgi:hypothetical protein
VDIERCPGEQEPQAGNSRQRTAGRSGNRPLFTVHRSLLIWTQQGASPMHITSPFFVVPVIIAVFVASILFATSSKEDGSTH